ncbi:hypothetical protein N7475_008372 [Penicillium sp. IBT 31633x]|nr:hypothetical protein N7475_008372 [Penicillium sp. IBT 31633x]
MQAASKPQKRRWEKVSETLPRKRARQSCEACKARKTKCVGVENGDCEYCKSLNVPCEFNLKSRKRPFYRVSEEAYDHLIKLLRRFVSEEELPELTVASISTFLDQMNNDPRPQISSEYPDRDAEHSHTGSHPSPRQDPSEMIEPTEPSLFQEELGYSDRAYPEDPMGPSGYLALAKELVPRAADDADIESVRAFALLSLAMHSNCYSLGAYLYLGTAARIGFSLGLHRDMFPKTLSTVERERYKRIWWTVYILDHEMANRFGYPCAIAENLGFMNTSPASEQILDPSPNMPQGLQALSVSLVQLQKKINLESFLEPSQGGGRLPINLVTQSLGTLRKWLEDVPYHLLWDCAVPPQHLRAIAVLHLRYWSSVLAISRPFLLLSVTKSGEIESAVRVKCYDKLSNACIEAAEMSVRILQREAMWILLLALRRARNSKHQDMLRICLGALSSMERVGWAERIVPDIEARVYESGVLDLEPPVGNQELNMPSDGPGSSEIADFDYDVSQWDVFQTQGLDSFAELMNLIPDGPFAAGMEHLF